MNVVSTVQMFANTCFTGTPSEQAAKVILQKSYVIPNNLITVSYSASTEKRKSMRCRVDFKCKYILDTELPDGANW
jgi:hypothetical protein